MSDARRHLPPRPSLEQLRKLAKERLRRLRERDSGARLADAQHILAREYGFESWPGLVRHVEGVVASGRLERFERLAQDLLAGYGGDASALERLGAWLGDSYDNEQRRVRVRDRVDGLAGLKGAPTLDDTRLVVARQMGFGTWAELADSLAQPAQPAGSSSARFAAPPFYTIDEERNVIRPRAPLTDRDWDTICAVMRERGITGVATPALTDAAAERLSRLDFVRTIEADGARGLSDDGLLLLGALPRLEELDLSGLYSPITDRGLVALRQMQSLRRLKMGWPQRVTDAGLAHLAACDRLETVDVMGTPSGNGVIAALAGKQELRSLKTGRLVTDAGIPLLHRIPAFRTWRGDVPSYGLMNFQGGPSHVMIDGPFTDRGLRELVGLDGLFSLSFFWHSKAFTSDGLAALRGLPGLGFLGCDGERCDDGAMRQIAAIPGLRALLAQGTVASDDGFGALSASPSIEYIWGRDCPNLRSRGFAALAAMPALKGLAVSCRQVDDAALATLPSFPSLQELVPMDVSEDGFRHVGACAGLEKLWCMYCRDTGDQATEHLTDLALRYYYAGKTRITDRSLDLLATLHTLEEIELWETAGITDAGIAALAKLPALRAISVDAVNVTRRGMSVFPPSVRVRF